jgi:creatinine amidohydrolase/Fe(II)-dependent formamide hydrolase-like protein
VLDRLEIGSPVLTSKRLSAPYRVTRGGKTASHTLVYRYEEDVFAPGDPSSLNLASMIAAQVALNYGLFCREIHFDGLFDASDRRFLEDMARNTAREIYVKKFLEPNPFLSGAAARLAPEKRESYLAARLTFADAPPGSPAGERWAVRPESHCVLSSGGKDSLLSFGLLDELKLEAHPIFVNESGRHWFTALNAYRHLQATCPRTARVWTNSDRLFAWMLRQLPFIRPDFADLRADIYPVRLWTVAVFLFGALPLLRRRGIGRLVIGDEHDTTLRATHHGIPHYEGLFDQSRYFDAALTRYFARKGWNVTQFSILRQMSELLIQKTLAERFPRLLEQQVSCHATHIEGRRVRPCGRCEKCRRIVSMLVATDGDPRRCGYDDEQIGRCLELFARHGAHQEAVSVAHVLHLLEAKGRAGPSTGAARPRAHPEVLKLRFERERSPMSALPTDLRRPLLRLLLERGTGAVRRQGRVWVPYDPLQDPEIDAPFRGDEQRAGPGTRVEGQPTSRPLNDYVLGQLSWPQAKTRLDETDLALLPVGAIEQHGPHLPLDTDAWDADYLARRVAAACSPPRPLVLPLIPYGVSYHHDDFPGTLSLTSETLARMVYEIGMNAARQGITKLIIVNGHGGNVPTLRYAAQAINRDAHIFTCVDTGDTSDPDVEQLVETGNDVHAGEIETSTALATRPELVQMDKARRGVPRFSSQYLEFSSARSVEWYARTARISSSGVLGDPTKASREKGERIWKVTIDHLLAFVESLKNLELDEIYERRY